MSSSSVLSLFGNGREPNYPPCHSASTQTQLSAIPPYRTLLEAISPYGKKQSLHTLWPPRLLALVRPPFHCLTNHLLALGGGEQPVQRCSYFGPNPGNSRLPGRIHPSYRQAAVASQGAKTLLPPFPPPSPTNQKSKHLGREGAAKVLYDGMPLCFCFYAFSQISLQNVEFGEHAKLFVQLRGSLCLFGRGHVLR